MTREEIAAAAILLIAKPAFEAGWQAAVNATDMNGDTLITVEEAWAEYADAVKEGK